MKIWEIHITADLSWTHPMLRNSASRQEVGLPGRIRPDPNRESLEIGPPAGFRPEANFEAFRVASGRNPGRKPDFRPGSTSA